jgi:hypothetical protein
MSKERQRPQVSLGDRLALEIQALHRRGKLRDTQPLLRIDQRREAAEAPYQLDAVEGRVHRNGCRAIAASSKSALYGVWEFRSGEQHLACDQCKPMPTKRKKTTVEGLEAPASDLLYGLLSILDQFGGVLRERGREYRRSHNGQQLRGGVRDLYESLGSNERDVLDVLANALGGLSDVVNDLQRSISATNGNTSGNGHGHGGRQHGVRRSRNGTNEP